MAILQYTPDSNVIINASIKKKECLEIIRLFLKEYKSEKCFLTPQVKRELSDIQPKISYLLSILKNHYVLKGTSIKQGYEIFLNSFVKDNDKKKFMQFSNIIDYLEQNKVTPTNIERFSSAIVEAIGRLTGRYVPIKPSEEDCRINRPQLELRSKYIEDHVLVIDREDTHIISELMFYIYQNKSQVEFITDNSRDFNNDDSAWLENPELKQITIIAANSFYSKICK